MFLLLMRRCFRLYSRCQSRMVRVRVFILVLASLGGGCIPFLSNEQQTKLWMSQEKRMESFKRDMDFRIGKEYRRPVPKTEWCKTYQCFEIDESVTEYVEVLTNKDVPTRTCVIAWRVDAKQSTGNYQHAPGPLFYGYGKTLSWRYVSKPEECLTTWTNFAFAVNTPNTSFASVAISSSSLPASDRTPHLQHSATASEVELLLLRVATHRSPHTHSNSRLDKYQPSPA